MQDMHQVSNRAKLSIKLKSFSFDPSDEMSHSLPLVDLHLFIDITFTAIAPRSKLSFIFEKLKQEHYLFGQKQN